MIEAIRWRKPVVVHGPLPRGKKEALNSRVHWLTPVVGLVTYKFVATLRLSQLMIMGGSHMKNFRRAKKDVDVSVGQSVRIIRELQGLPSK
jgi:hypothetical protein